MKRNNHINNVPKTLVLVVSILVLSNCFPIDMDALFESATIKFEYDYMAGHGIGNYSMNYSNVEAVGGYISEAFDAVGLSTTIYQDDENILPAYPGFGNLFPNDILLLIDYTNEHDNADYPWHLLSVDKFESNNPIGGLGLIFGVSSELDMGVHLPPSTPANRYSFIFAGDIVTDYLNYGDTQNIAAALITTTVHELGHQRAGLTDPSHAEFYSSHANSCVMGYYGPSSVTLEPRFCKTIDSPGQETNCAQVIESNYDNY